MSLPTIKFVAVILTLSFFCGSTSSIADDNIQIRQTYLQAEKALAKGNMPKFNELYNKLHYYPLQPYLDQQVILENLATTDVKKINEFLNQYSGTPLDWSLRRKWLNYLAQTNQKELFLEFYKPTSSAALNCTHYLYQLDNGVPESVVLPQVTKLWVVGKSQANECDPLFDLWQKAGYRTSDLVWQRIRLAGDGGTYSLLPYLTKLLPDNEQYLGDLWYKVRINPAYIQLLTRFPKKNDKEAEIMTYGLKRLIWRDPESALITYKKAVSAFNFTDEQLSSITNKFAIALASKNYPEAEVWLDKVDEKSISKTMVQYRLTHIIKEQHWEKYILQYNLLPVEYKNALQWKYWYARALNATGESEQGQSLLKQLAHERHYYGFLAASNLKLPVNLQDEPIVISEEERMSVLQAPAAKRAFELFYIDRANQARREWDYWMQSLSQREKLVASKVANEAKWYDRAIFTLSKVGYLNDVDLRFPQAFSEEINQYAGIQQINSSWAFAIARRESSFMPDARSPVGAKGLMQLMPRTAKELNKKSISTKELYNSGKNIKLGTQYLKDLLKLNKGNHVMATASYNAGPHRVKAWTKDSVPLPADIWIETIPFRETREYVKSVLAYQQIYQIKKGKADSLFDELVGMNIPENKS